METASLSRSCTNCNASIMGSYCHQCGRKHKAGRTNIIDVLNALLGGVLSLERSLPGTLWRFLMKPSVVINDFWNGSRGYYLSPGQMIFYTIFILGLHIAFINDKLLGFSIRVTGVEGGTSLLLTPQLLFLILMLPLTIITISLTYRRRDKTISEHVIAAVYVFSFSVIAATLIADITGSIFDKLNRFTTLIFLFILFLTGARVYSVGRKWYILLRDFLIQFLVFALLVTLIVISLYFVNPDVVNLGGGE